MGIYRMYTGNDGDTHIEESPLDAHPKLSNLQDVQGLKLQRTEGGRFLDWRPAPDATKVDVAGNVRCTGPGGAWVMDCDEQTSGNDFDRSEAYHQHCLRWRGLEDHVHYHPGGSGPHPAKDRRYAGPDGYRLKSGRRG